ncbi:MAG: AsmA family protein [Alphaproteobacteria bacterium]|nr:AsmA family protein [Alphaproteobacteria bacterium]
MIRLIRYLFLLAIILVSSLYVILLFVDLNHFKEPIEREVSSLLNRKVEVGRIELKMSLVPKLSIKDLSIKNPDGFVADKPFAIVGTTDLTFSIVPLFQGILQVDAVHLDNAKIYLIQKENLNNWTFESVVKNEKKEETPSYGKRQFDVRRIKVDQFSISDSIVTYDSGKTYEVAVINSFSLNQLQNATLQLNYKNTPIQMTFATSNLLQVLRSGYLKDFTLNLRAYDGLVKVSGQMENIYELKNMNFSFDVSSPDLGKTLSLFGEKEFSQLANGKPFSMVFSVIGSLDTFKLSGITAEIKNMANLHINSIIENIATEPKISVKASGEVKSHDITNRYGIQPATIDVDALYVNKKIDLNKFSLFINRSDVFVKGSVDLSKKVPFVKGEIHSNYFDLSDIVAEKEGLPTKSAEKSELENMKDKPLDFAFLKKINGELSVFFSNLKVLKTDKDYHKGILTVYLNDGHLKLNPYRFDFLNGNINGDAMVNVATQPMSLSLNLTGLGLMISDLKEVSPHLRNATGNIFVKVQSQGDSLKSIMGHLSGEVKAQISSGLIVNKWFNSLPSLIGIATKNSAFSYADTEAQSELNCAAMKLDIKDGVVKSDKNIAIETAVMNLVVSGNIDFANETLSLSLIPSLNHLNNKVNKKLSFAQYVRLQGPFSDIKMSEDTAGALADLRDKELEKLKNKLTGDKSDKKNDYVPIGGLCQIALGEDIFTTDTKKTDVVDGVKQTESPKNTVQDVKESLKEQVKDQITKSLTEILKRK